MSGKLILDPIDLPVKHQAIGTRRGLERHGECCEWDLVVRAAGYRAPTGAFTFNGTRSTRVFISEVVHQPGCPDA